MAPIFPFVTCIFVTFLLSVQARDLSHRQISFVSEPKDSYFLVKKRPAVIVCAARHAADISFTCAGTQVPPSSVEMEDSGDPSIVKAKMKVTRSDVQNHPKRKGAFWCECNALDFDGQQAATSRRATISLSFIKHRFQAQPQGTDAIEGDNVEFSCGAPNGKPKPEVLWRKDKRRINLSAHKRLVVTDQGSLVIESVTKEDEGVYSCVAKNPAGRKESKGAQLTVTVFAESSEPVEEVSSMDADGNVRIARQSRAGEPVFTTIPQESYQIRPSEDIQMDCAATGASILTFRCNGQRMQRERVETQQGRDNSGVKVVQAQLTLSYADITDYFSQFGDTDPYFCQCVAWYQGTQGAEKKWVSIHTSDSLGTVILSYLDRTFQVEPTDLTVGIDTDATMQCEPPKGQPTPWVYWVKDRTRLEPREDDHYSINDAGHLTIHKVQYEDSGVYQCLAENTVEQVQSRRARLIVTDRHGRRQRPDITRPPRPSPTAPPTTTTSTAAPMQPMDSKGFLIDLEPKYVISEGGSVNIVCSVPANQLSFMCGNARIEPNVKKTNDFDDRYGKPVFYAEHEVTADEVLSAEGDFFCQCQAWVLNDGEWEQLPGEKGYFTVGEQEEEVFFLDKDFVYAPTDLTVEAEDEAELSCEPPKGNPEPTVYWMKDGVRIDPDVDTNYIVLEEGPLIIEYARTADAGMYTCMAENSAGRRAANPVQLTVHATPTTPMVQPVDPTDYDYTTPNYEDYDFELKEPLFALEPVEASYITDQDARLTCSVVAAKSLVFACNGQVIKASATTGSSLIEPQSKQEIRENALTITRDQIEAWTGSEPYSCVCRAFYQKEGTADGDYSYIDSNPGIVQIAYFKKKFELEPVEQDVQPGHTAELRCIPPAAVPKPLVHWLKDGFRLQEDERIKVDLDGNLMISAFDYGDQGEYTCVAENDFKRRTSRTVTMRLGDADESVVVPEVKPEEGGVEPSSEPEGGAGGTGVIFNERAGTPFISKELHSDYYLIKNKPVTIMCEAYNVNYITFSCGMESIDASRQIDVMQEAEMEQEDGTRVLQKVVKSSFDLTKDDLRGDEFWCQCYAHYTVPGMDDEQILSSQKGYVELAYLKRNFQKYPQNEFKMEGDFLSVECAAPLGNPQPQVSWTKDGERVEALNVMPNGALIFEALTPEDAGSYVCIAENVVGKRMAPAVLLSVDANEGVIPDPEGGDPTAEEHGGETDEEDDDKEVLVGGDDNLGGGVDDGDVVEGEPTGEPAVEPTPESEVEPTGEPEHEVVPDVEPEVEPTGEAEEGQIEDNAEPETHEEEEGHAEVTHEGGIVDDNDENTVVVGGGGISEGMQEGGYATGNAEEGQDEGSKQCTMMMQQCMSNFESKPKPRTKADCMDYQACFDRLRMTCEGDLNDIVLSLGAKTPTDCSNMDPIDNGDHGMEDNHEEGHEEDHEDVPLGGVDPETADPVISDPETPDTPDEEGKTDAVKNQDAVDGAVSVSKSTLLAILLQFAVVLLVSWR